MSDLVPDITLQRLLIHALIKSPFVYRDLGYARAGPQSFSVGIDDGFFLLSGGPLLNAPFFELVSVLMRSEAALS